MKTNENKINSNKNRLLDFCFYVYNLSYSMLYWGNVQDIHFFTLC